MGEELRHDKRIEAARSGSRDEPRASLVTDDGDPTETGARSRRTDELDLGASAVSELRPTSGAARASEGPLRPSRPWQPSQPVHPVGRVSRPSIRPSAFGLPRSSSPVPAGSQEKKRESVPPGISSGRAPAESIPPRVSQTLRKKRISARVPAVKTDIEELLPLSQGVKSLPRPPRVPTFETQQMPLASARRFPWASLGVFIVMLFASFAPLSRYRGERQDASALAAEQRNQRISDADDPSLSLADARFDVTASALEPRPLMTSQLPLSQQGGAGLGAIDSTAGRPRARFDLGSRTGARAQVQAPSGSRAAPFSSRADARAAMQIERALWGEPARVREALLQEAEHALQVGQLTLAVSLFERGMDFDGDFDGDDARAEFGLARLRLALDDPDSAEVWALRAIHKRPRRLEYRALLAEILQRQGRGAEAQMERAVARALAHFARGTRAR